MCGNGLRGGTNGLRPSQCCGAAGEHDVAVQTVADIDDALPCRSLRRRDCLEGLHADGGGDCFDVDGMSPQLRETTDVNLEGSNVGPRNSQNSVSRNRCLAMSRLSTPCCGRGCWPCGNLWFKRPRPSCSTRPPWATSSFWGWI